jgi:hypothetical protein
MIRYCGAALLLGALLSLSACYVTLTVTKINDTYSTDSNGNIIDVQTWRYGDGEVVQTTRITDQNGNFTRRGDPEAHREFFDPF